MPESYGKKQRRNVKAKKQAARDERRLARAKRKSDREAGLIEPGTPIQATPPEDLALTPLPTAEGRADEEEGPAT
ncbi:MAG TPA: hypothetical protein VE669_07060 [Actinomycetota bacterium]|jgi:hypothetical protein|nr:hypothetical protein [Actinomycetota bacterium]